MKNKKILKILNHPFQKIKVSNINKRTKQYTIHTTYDP